MNNGTRYLTRDQALNLIAGYVGGGASSGGAVTPPLRVLQKVEGATSASVQFKSTDEYVSVDFYEKRADGSTVAAFGLIKSISIQWSYNELQPTESEGVVHITFTRNVYGVVKLTD